MIVTVTLNPLLERRYTFSEINYPGSSRDGKVLIQAGGKGINVSRQLNRLGTPGLAFTFLGGNNGRLLRDILKKEDINFTAVKTDGETREGVVLVDEKRRNVTSLFGENSDISAEEADEFKEKLDKIIQNCEMVIFSGSSPCENTRSLIQFGIEAANRYDKISVCDTYGNHLEGCINEGPTILHNNLDELRSSLNMELGSENSILSLMEELYKKGIKQSYITNAEKKLYCSNFDFHFKVVPPEVETFDPTGSGDSFMAGIIYGWHNDLTFEEGLKLAVSLGALNASRSDVSAVPLKDTDQLISSVEVIPIGKKMKTLDVTPR
jgi:tagatose 6-phosphate kinase